MTETMWFLVVGGVLIFMGLASSTFKHLPISTAMCYLAIGFALGPGGRQSALARPRRRCHRAAPHHRSRDARVAVRDRPAPARAADRPHLASADAARLRRDGAHRRRAHARLPSYVLGLNWGPALLLAAMLAPTDPVLAHDVQVESTRRHRLAALLADGRRRPERRHRAAVRAARHRGVQRTRRRPDQALSWAFAGEALWGVAGALASGWLLGDLSVRLVAFLRTRHGQALGPEGFYALGLIALSYGVAELLHTYAFLAVFAAGLSMRRVEQKASGDKSPREAVGNDRCRGRRRGRRRSGARARVHGRARARLHDRAGTHRGGGDHADGRRRARDDLARPVHLAGGRAHRRAVRRRAAGGGRGVAHRLAWRPARNGG